MTVDVFYPIVPDIVWLKRLVPLGLKTVQLRLKNASRGEIARQIAEALVVTRANGCQLVVNDHWREAMAAGADFVHLGQEDLASADLAAIKAAKLRLGVSTHTGAELEAALRTRPDYIALGPIFETQLKKMKWTPQGLSNVRKWKSRLRSLHLVAIGGITPERAPRVLAAGADSVSLITDVLTAPHPEERVKQWLEWAGTQRKSL